MPVDSGTTFASQQSIIGRMTVRQKILKAVYPLFQWISQRGTTDKNLHNDDRVVPPVSFYSLSMVLSNGKELSFATLKGKKVLLVNTASDCGYTQQYEALQKLYLRSKEKVEIIAFPANDFKEQERGSDEEISRFCSVNYGVSFPLAKKAKVIKGVNQHPVYQWLTEPGLNGWNSKAPSWNFAKYLVNEEGLLTGYFAPAVLPTGDALQLAVQA
jgi:glutathione peroxidase